MLAIVHRNIAILAIYRPPHGSQSDFLDYLDSFLEFVNLKKWHVVIIGDFNIDVFSDNNTTVNLVERMFPKGCENLIEQPTRLTLTSRQL